MTLTATLSDGTTIEEFYDGLAVLNRIGDLLQEGATTVHLTVEEQ